MYDHVTPFPKRTNSSMTNCSLTDGLENLIKDASNIFSFRHVFRGPSRYSPFKLMVFQVLSWFRLYIWLRLQIDFLKQHFSRIHQHSFHYMNNYLRK